MSDRREAAGDQAAPAAASAASAAASTGARPSQAAVAGASVVGKKRWWSLVALCLSAAIVWFAAANIPVATTAISDDIGGSVTALQWANTIFTLTCGALVIAAGRLGDIFGRRRVLGIGLVIFAGASVLAALARTPELLIAGRALMGAGAAGVLPATLAIIPIEFHGKDQVTAFSAWMAVTAVGQAAAPAISGGLTQFLGWPAIFWVNVPLCVLAFVLVNRTTAESRDEARHRLDYVGLWDGLLPGILQPIERAAGGCPRRHAGAGRGAVPSAASARTAVRDAGDGARAGGIRAAHGSDGGGDRSGFGRQRRRRGSRARR